MHDPSGRVIHMAFEGHSPTALQGKCFLLPNGREASEVMHSIEVCVDYATPPAEKERNNQNDHRIQDSKNCLLTGIVT
jgi:hypothetical protein